jgi:uncharacterized membrane protein YqhA
MRLHHLDRLDPDHEHPLPHAPLARWIGRTRFVVMLPVGAVLLVAILLFLLGTWLTLQHSVRIVLQAFGGQADFSSLTVELLEIVSLMLKAVIFYIIGIGFYSLFVAPLNVTAALGVETFSDLESKIVSVIVVIMAITFLEHFIAWQQPNDILQFGIALALVIGVLTAYQFVNQHGEEQGGAADTARRRAQKQLFEHDQEQEEIRQQGEEQSLDGSLAEAEPGRRGRTR